jgi:hypothetical protein
MVVVPNIDVVKKGVLIGLTKKLGSESSGVSAVRNLNRSSALPTTTIGVVGMPQMVFTNPITTIHVNKTANRPLMNSMDARRYTLEGKGQYVTITFTTTCNYLVFATKFLLSTTIVTSC